MTYERCQRVPCRFPFPKTGTPCSLSRRAIDWPPIPAKVSVNMRRTIIARSLTTTKRPLVRSRRNHAGHMEVSGFDAMLARFAVQAADSRRPLVADSLVRSNERAGSPGSTPSGRCPGLRGYTPLVVQGDGYVPIHDVFKHPQRPTRSLPRNAV